MPVKEHADADKEEYGEGVLQRQRFRRRTMRKAAFTHHHAGKEGPQRKTHMEDFRCAVGDADRCGQYKEREEFARPRTGNLPHGPRQHSAADDEHDGHKKRGVEKRLTDHPENVGIGQTRRGPGRPRHHQIGKGRQQHEDEHGGNIFDHQPAHRNASVGTRQFAAHVKCL